MADIAALTPRRDISDPAARDWFWTLVDASIDADEDPQLAKLRAALDALPNQDLVDFIGFYEAVHRSLYSWRLWAAGYLLNGGCGDDGFIDFRAWLISRGRAVAERAVADVDTLADLSVEADTATFEGFGYVGSTAFGERSGGAFPAFGPGGRSGEPAEPDWRFDFDDDGQMRSRLPRLAALYL